MIQELRLAIRNLTRVPGFAAAFILTLGLGIGANTAIFSVINGVLLRPLPYPEAGRIMHLRQPQAAAGVEDSSFSFPEVAHYRSRSKTIDQFVEFGDWTFNVLGRGDPHRATGGLVTANATFRCSGAQPLLRHMLRPGDEGKGCRRRGAHPCLLAARVRRRPSAVGRTLDLTTTKAQIVGVLKPGSHYAAQRPQDFYVNYAANDHYSGAAMQNDWPHRMTTVYARLAPGATPASAQAELKQIAAGMYDAHPEAYPKSRGFDIVVMPWKDELTAKAKPTLVILLVTTVFVLIIACANVANLTLTRLVQREREMGIRAALGAAPWRLVRALVVEGLMLSLGGAAIGIMLAQMGVRVLRVWLPAGLPRVASIAIDLRVLAAAVGAAVATGLVFGVVPAFQSARPDLVGSLKEGGRSATAGGRAQFARSVLVVAEVALAVVLLVGAGLFTSSFVSLLRVDPGFDYMNVLALNVGLRQLPGDLSAH